MTDVIDRLLGVKRFGMGSAAGSIREGRWKPKLPGSLPPFLYPDPAVLTLECIKLLTGNCLDPLLNGLIYFDTHDSRPVTIPRERWMQEPILQYGEHYKFVVVR